MQHNVLYRIPVIRFFISDSLNPSFCIRILVFVSLYPFPCIRLLVSVSLYPNPFLFSKSYVVFHIHFLSFYPNPSIRIRASEVSVLIRVFRLPYRTTLPQHCSLRRLKGANARHFCTFTTCVSLLWLRLDCHNRVPCAPMPRKCSVRQSIKNSCMVNLLDRRPSLKRNVSLHSLRG